MNRLKDERGMAGVSVIVAVMVIILCMSLYLEYNRASIMQEHVETELSRALNTSMQLALFDDYRREQLAVVNEEEAKRQFYIYLRDVMGLNAANEFQENGERLYSLTIDTLTIKQQPPKMQVTGSVHMPVKLFSGLVTTDIELTFNITSGNQRMD